MTEYITALEWCKANDIEIDYDGYDIEVRVGKKYPIKHEVSEKRSGSGMGSGFTYHQGVSFGDFTFEERLYDDVLEYLTYWVDYNPSTKKWEYWGEKDANTLSRAFLNALPVGLREYARDHDGWDSLDFIVQDRREQEKNQS